MVIRPANSEKGTKGAGNALAVAFFGGGGGGGGRALAASAEVEECDRARKRRVVRDKFLHVKIA